MALSKKLMAGGLAVLALVATTAAATAVPAYAAGNVNVRSGPSIHYRVVDTLRRGERVDVQQCRGSWCYIEKRGPEGWVSANYLSRNGHGGWDDDNWNRPDYSPPHWRPRPPRPPYGYHRPQRPVPVYPSYPHNSGGSFCVNGPNGYFCIGN
ncbi:MAG: SH3 domain-containing protein [Candidatus Devosia euplotis]|nr:SH3 domain-containing protein [Candidatus Devosia euplotis]